MVVLRPSLPIDPSPPTTRPPSGPAMAGVTHAAWLAAIIAADNTRRRRFKSRLSLNDRVPLLFLRMGIPVLIMLIQTNRSEEHTSELQSRGHLVCRLLL